MKSGGILPRAPGLHPGYMLGLGLPHRSSVGAASAAKLADKSAPTVAASSHPAYKAFSNTFELRW